MMGEEKEEDDNVLDTISGIGSKLI